VSEVFAGFVCGYALALLSTPLLAILLIQLRARSELLARLLPANASAMSVGVLLHGAMFLFWTALGILLGLVLLAMGDSAGAFGSTNPPFSLFVVGLAVAISAPVAFAAPRLRTAALTGVVLFVLLFGWLMPHMAGWTNFEPPPGPPPERSDVSHA
jgi:hypothetical protein